LAGGKRAEPNQVPAAIPDYIAPLVRNDYLAKVDEASFERIVNDVSAKITTEDPTKFNAEYVFDKKDIATIATAWLTSNGLVFIDRLSHAVRFRRRFGSSPLAQTTRTSF